MPRPCRSTPRRPYVDTLGAALHVVDASAAGAAGATFVLLLDGDDRLLAVVEATDAAGDVDGLVAACVALLDAAGPRWRATVVASDRPGTGGLAGSDDRAAWVELGRAFRDAGVVLVDWLLLDGDLVGSLAGQVDGVDVWTAG